MNKTQLNNAKSRKNAAADKLVRLAHSNAPPAATS